ARPAAEARWDRLLHGTAAADPAPARDEPHLAAIGLVTVDRNGDGDARRPEAPARAKMAPEAGRRVLAPQLGQQFAEEDLRRLPRRDGAALAGRDGLIRGAPQGPLEGTSQRG